MAQARESVVTPERFASGMTYNQYAASIQRNQERFEQNYKVTELSEDDAQAFRELATRPDGPAKVLVITEDWCPDCYREVPVMARIAEAAGMELRILPRDANKDVMAEFLKDGQHESIPAFVFYTRDHRYITHWIERSAQANEQQVTVRKLFENKSREEAQAEYAQFQQGNIWAGWRRAAIKELRELLAKSQPQ